MAKNKYGFTPEICKCCGQARTYLLPIDWGTTVILKAVAAAVRNKGINMIHPTKEMEMPSSNWTYYAAIHHGMLTSTQIGNMTRARVHGLIARSQKEAGNWVLTRKGAAFLRGERIPRLAVIEKTRKTEGGRSHKIDYFKPEENTCTVHEINTNEDIPVWEGIDFDIVEGRIVVDVPPTKEQKQAQTLFDDQIVG